MGRHERRIAGSVLVLSLTELRVDSRRACSSSGKKHRAPSSREVRKKAVKVAKHLGRLSWEKTALRRGVQKTTPPKRGKVFSLDKALGKKGSLFPEWLTAVRGARSSTTTKRGEK